MRARKTAVPVPTREKIMTAARAILQARGYNALSFRVLAKAVRIKSASVHYHFPTKGDLGAALARRYTDDALAIFEGWTAAGLPPEECLDNYIVMFRDILVRGNRMCLAGILSAERDDLPAAVRAEVERFTDVNVDWLTAVLAMFDSGKPAKVLRQRALAIVSATQGALLVARGRGEISLFDQAMDAFTDAGLFFLPAQVLASRPSVPESSAPSK